MSKIVTLNSLREIKVYELGQKTLTFFVNISPESYNFGIPFHFPQFYFNQNDFSVLFNGRDYCAYNSLEEAEHMKPVESEVY